MISQFLVAHAWAFIFWGVVVSLIGGIWALFAAYRSDVSLARAAVFLFPILISKITVEHPRAFLIPSLINTTGFLIVMSGIFGLWLRMSGLH